MTKEEFINTLVGWRTLKFGDSEVRTHARLVCDAIADDLQEVLPSSERVFYGVQVSDFDPEKKWAGKLTWVLLLGASLLEVTAEMTKTDTGQALKVNHTFHPTYRLVKVRLDVQHREVMRARPTPVPYEASLVMDFGNGTPVQIGPVKAEFAREFMVALLGHVWGEGGKPLLKS